MATVVLNQVRVELTAEQVVAAFRQLPASEQEKVWRELSHEEWEQRLRDVLGRVWARLESQPISDQEIDEEIAIVRDIRRARQEVAQSSH